MNWIRQFTGRLARWQIVAITGVPALILFGIFNFYPGALPYLVQAGAGVPPLDLHFFGYSPEAVHSLFNSYGADGRQRYRLFLYADLIFAVTYGLLFAGLLRLALRPPLAAAASRWNDLCLLPLLTGAADCVENVCNLTLVAIFPSLPPALVYAASTATIAKWALALAALVSLLVASCIRLIGAWRRSSAAG